MTDIIVHNQGLLMVFFFVLAVGFLAAAVFFGVMLRNTEKKADQRLKQARADITDMTILFQTMRDIIGQQKALAKDFNEEIEHKMEQVKHILNQGMEKNKQLYDKQQRIASELEDAQARIDSIYRHIANVQAAPAPQARPTSNGSAIAASAPPASAPPASAPPASAPRASAPPVENTPAPPSRHPVPVARENAPPAPRPQTRPPAAIEGRAAATPGLTTAARVDPRDLPASPQNPVIRTGKAPRDTVGPAPLGHIIPDEDAKFTDTGLTRAAFTSWIAEDLDSRPDPPARPAPAPAPEEERPPAAVPALQGRARPATTHKVERDPADNGPNDGDAAREAFRALLNMPPSRQMDGPPLDILPGADFVTLDPAAHEFGEDHMAGSLQKRVLEYSEAGMTVAQVSRELGIGKGEVRLMLSLAKQQSPQRE